MLYNIDWQCDMNKQEYSDAIKQLQDKFSVLGQTIKNSDIPVIILFEGWGASGKGSFITDIIQNLDPRNFKVYSVSSPSDLEKRMPDLWRFWKCIPCKGQIAIFDRSWYYDVSVGKIDGSFHHDAEKAIENINIFERQLTDNGYLIIKLFLHITKKEQAKRFAKLKQNPETAWRVTENDLRHHKEYATHLEVFGNMLTRTDTEYAPWTIVQANNKKYARVKIFDTIISKIHQVINKPDNPTDTSQDIPKPVFSTVKVKKLEQYSLDKSISEETYKSALEREQKKLSKLHNIIYQKKIPVIIVYEGWDASGKGGNIKRITQALDPRGFEVVPISAPSQTQHSYHYMWRFWNNLPKTGHIQIFDRSWYGRVLVERVEQITPAHQWSIAYNEICEFEKYLCDWGAVIVKYWLHIDKQQQLERFKNRQNTPEKSWKITDEDWRNREKWDEYQACCNDMLKYTSTQFAPWTVIESNDKKFARIKAMKTLIKAIEKRL